ncbi:GumC family protein [Parabacteroides bouchesdurhonensis]|uniref:GumC family protein n=1 Tax=Parabacteroides bouchesdurhonensis TaxID=1936995 RepID=UPI000C82C34C|nr:hypothetical protein [Parabacteroides bouchesdurhonensis]
MDITLYISRFLYRIRYQLLYGSLVVTVLVMYFSQFLPKTYTVNTSIYTGIASNSGLEPEERTDWLSVNNTFDNIVNLTKSKGTLEKVSIKLLALNLINGDPDKDNTFILAKNYRNLLTIIPPEVIKLVDKTSFDKTVNNLIQYQNEDPLGVLYTLFNGKAPFYSYSALSQIIVRRLGNSDLIDISYQSSDPGITLNTVKLVSEELRVSYDKLRYKTADDIVKYYEEELRKLKVKLNNLENALTEYNVQNSVINYIEQTKAIAISFTDFENRYENTLRQYQSSNQLIKELEGYMELRASLIKSNEEFIKTLDKISSINGKITEIETFTSEEAQASNETLQQYREELQQAEKNIAQLTEQINTYKASKEGVAIDELVNEWLTQVILNIKSKKELEILDKRKQDFINQYKEFSPIGTQINRQEREIKVTEESYLEVLHALNLAKMKQKNLLLTSATLNTISTPTFPLLSNSKRMLFTIVAFIGSLIFILGLNLVIELLDRTLRDAERTKRLTGMSVKGAFTGNTQLKYRGYIKACNRISAAQICNQLNHLLQKDKTIYINLLSIEEKEGKSFVAKYLMEQWDEQGINVKYVQANKDFPTDASYLLAQNFNIFSPIQKNVNIVLVEHLSIQTNNIPSALIENADINLLIVNAQKVWKNSDNEILNYLQQITGNNTSIFMVLNNAQRDAVEDFTGQLPPQSSMRSFANRIMYLGLTSKDSAVKK